MQYLDDLSLETDNSIESFPEPQEVSDQELLRRMLMPGEYNEDGRKYVTEMLQRVLKISDEDMISCKRMRTTTIFNEEKMEVFGDMSLHMTMVKYYVSKILIFEDYRMSANF